MSSAIRRPVPRTFFLNEHHELSRGEKESGGSLPKLAPIDWGKKGRKIHHSLSSAREVIAKSRDPLRESKYFLATIPTPKIKKFSENRRRAPAGVLEEDTDYAGSQSLVFRRLGLDLLTVDDEGRALIHAPVPRFEQLLTTASSLQSEGLREQARWVAIDSFSPVPISFRLDEEWLEELGDETYLDAVVELQPLLTRVEVERVIQAVIEAVSSGGNRNRFTRTGTDFSGRHWYRGLLSRRSIRLVAENFYSVQALHPPLETKIAISSRSGNRSKIASSARRSAIDPRQLPVIAVVDVGVPSGHARLAPFRRGAYVSPDAPVDLVAEHGSHVAGRVVFGDLDFWGGIGEATPSCAFLDVNVASSIDGIDDKAVVPALQAVVATFPDVRVFNLSFGDVLPLDSHSPVQRREKLLLVQDLDNLVFRSDVIVVVAAGNSRQGLVPSPEYPHHADHPEWALGSWAVGFNTLTCGSYVDHLSANGLVRNLGWPSPFTRIGPGLCDAPIPEYSASGGNCTAQYQFAAGLGVWTCNAAGVWEDHVGTSLAAPLLAREAAFAMQELLERCEQGARPFASTVKAFLALTAAPPVHEPAGVVPLVGRSLGRGTASAERLRVPRPETVVLIWQGVLNGPEEKARIQIPIPRAWLRVSGRPRIRVVVAWESPVNAATEHVWASRRVEFQLRANPSSKALVSHGKNHRCYPLLERFYDLSADVLARRGVSPPSGDLWVLEVSYKEVAAYVATVELSAHQRVGVAIEVWDDSASKESPQRAMQALPEAVTMNRLTVPEHRNPNPVVVRPRV